jgi:hypothetical protein
MIHAQDIPVSSEQQLENLAEWLEMEIEDDHYLQQLNYLMKHPLALQRVNAEELLQWLTDLQIQQFINYREHMGPFISIYELQAIPAWDLVTIRKTIPFVTIEDRLMVAQNISNRFLSGDHTGLFRISSVVEKQKGFNKSEPGHYKGSKEKLLFRYKYQYKNLLQIGITSEKDPGEVFTRGNHATGFDFYSYHLFLRNIGNIKALALGDYTINLGQGLIHWQSMAFRKSADVIQVKRQGPVLQPYNSAGEFNFLRGVASTWQKRRVSITGFASLKRNSGNVILDTAEGNVAFSSFNMAGLHRTDAELADRKQVKYLATGGTITVHTKQGSIGWNAVHHVFDKPLQKQDRPYNRYALSGKQWTNYSMDYQYTYKNLHVFGEAAVDRKASKAFVAGSMLSLHPSVDAAFVYRNISKRYQSFLGNAFTENTLPSNEQGLYTAVAIRPAYGWRVNLYADSYHFPWLKFRVNGPSMGRDLLGQIVYQPRKGLEIEVRYRNEQKSLNQTAADSAIYFLSSKTREAFRLHLQYQYNKTFSLRARTELVWFNHKAMDEEEGFLIYLQARYDISQKIAANIRLQYFETSGYNSRIYAYENDVLYGYSIPAFYDNGIRYYVNVQFDISKKLHCWLRWAQTIFDNKDKIGSGMDEINGNIKSDYRLQLRYEW